MPNRRRRIIVWIVAAIVALALVALCGPYLYFWIACHIAYCDL
jgi:hypothetical protein